MSAYPDQKINKEHPSFRLHALVLIGIVVCVGAFFAYTMRFNQEVSEVENRRLAQWPTFNKEVVLNGQYAKDVESYVADHFPGRSWLTEVAFVIRTYRGVQLNDRVIQVKGADTGFEDVSQWARADITPEITPEIVPVIVPENVPEHVPENVPENVTEIVSEIAPEVVPEITHSETLASNDEKITSDPLIVDEIDHIGVVIKPFITQAPVLSQAPVATQSPVVTKAPVVTQAPVVTKTPIVPQAPVVTKTPSSPPKKISPPQSVAPPQNKPLNVVGGVLLHDGQALFMFQGTDRGAQGYAHAVNTWVELVAKKRAGMTSTVVVTPTSSHFYLPPAARARTTSEAKNLAAMRDALLPEVRFADVITEMEGHQDQPLFYKSDHHWTGLGAYYAYRAWAKAAGVTPLELSAFDKRSVPGVAGSFWSLTQAPELRHADKESYYYVPQTVKFDGTQYTGPQQKTPVPQPFFAEKSRGYIVFLGGDIPLLASNTTAGTGRTALVIKNSYGNAFAPYLLPHFDRVVVLDYRYVSRNIQDIVDTFGVTDLVFVNATITANSGAHQERMRQVARGSSTAWLTEAEKRRIKQQEDAQ
jgi:hypothetical protein